MKSLKRFDRQVYKYNPDQMILRLNDMVGEINKTNVRSVEERGWKVFDYGSWKEYEYVLTYSVNVTNGQRTLAALVDLPVGTSAEDFSFSVSGLGGFSGHAVYGLELSGSQLAFYIGNEYSGGSLLFGGVAYIRLREL